SQGCKMRRHLSLSIGLVFLLSAGAWAQRATQTGLMGTVTDGAGGVLPGAQVVAVNLGTKDTYEARTNSEGNYYVQFVRPGKYEITVTVNRFTPFRATSVEAITNELART